MNLLSTNDDDILLAANALTAGRLVAFPTETVYGLGADAFNPAALARIFEAKGRPRFDPLIVHIAALDALPRIANLNALSPAARRQFDILSAQLWPGPLTLILPKRPEVPDLATSGLPSVAIRFPSHPVAQNLIARSTGAVAAPSANPFGYLSPTCAEHVRDQLGERVDFIIDGGLCSVGVESTVLDLSAGPARILRPGGTSRERIEALIGPVLAGSESGGGEGGTEGTAPVDHKGASSGADDSNTVNDNGNSIADSESAVSRRFTGDSTPAPNSPGQLKSHYAPRTPLSLHTPAEMAALRYNPADGYLFFDGASRDAWHGLDEARSDAAQGRKADRVSPPDCARSFIIQDTPRIQTLSETGSITEAAANLFSVLHYMDTLGIARIHAERAPGESLGPAINDRLGRAAAAYLFYIPH
jgi:L-threonylcarbamoyladenylate synthase